MSIPVGATHKGELGRYYKCVQGEWFYANHFGHWRKYYSGRPFSLKSLAQPKPWSGPQDGLPPIGIEFEWRYGTDEWKKGKALYFGMVYAILRSHDGEQHYYLREMEFRAIRTPEQIARDLRESKIVEFMNTVGIDCRVTATKAVDAGYVRVGE